MIFHFNIEYSTNWGEEIALNVSFYRHQELCEARVLPLSTCDGLHWYANQEYEMNGITHLEYRFMLLIDGSMERQEKESHHLPMQYIKSKEVTLRDTWQEEVMPSCLNSSAFKYAIFHYNKDLARREYIGESVVGFSTFFVPKEEGQQVALVGSSDGLNNWQPDKAIPMYRVGAYIWHLVLPLWKISNFTKYKYVLLNKEGHFIEWEEGEDRNIGEMLNYTNSALILHDGVCRFKKSLWHGAGVVIPVFSLKSNQSMGIGDFSDLKTMVDWAAQVRLHLLQILPINDTAIYNNWRDSYPYNSLSVFALNPLYLSLTEYIELLTPSERSRYNKDLVALNALDCLDYEAVKACKWSFIKIIYERIGQEVLTSYDYQIYFRANKQWLFPYAAFCGLKEKFNTADFRCWPSFNNYSIEVDRYFKQHKEEEFILNLHYFVQYLLHKQLKAVHCFARQKGVILKGDIPIGISRDSVSAWCYPGLFNFESQAGAPPDDFSEDGQNWGFPTYNWKAMERDRFAWWRKRFKIMATYFDAYRIDHVLGFFRIWEIPREEISGLLGRFNPALPLTKSEIERSGFVMNEERYTQPLITEKILLNLFGEETERVIMLFLKPHDGRYLFKDEFKTQRSLQHFFQNDPSGEELCEKLQQLQTNLLFIKAGQNGNGFYPRILAQKSQVFSTLSEEQQVMFNTLYYDFYYRRHNLFWEQKAFYKLESLINATPMLPCAEDLGMVPECVPFVLHQLGILTLEIQRMPKISNVRFANLQANPYSSVATISTHDMPPLRLWWKQDKERRTNFYRTILKEEGECPENASPDICEKVITEHLHSPSMLVALALQDWLALDESVAGNDIEGEQINDPSNPNQYWNYRMPLTLEELKEASGLNQKIKQLVETSKRI